MFRFLRKKRKVFLSSTSADLAAWRRCVRARLVDHGLEVLTMDEFPAMAQGAGPGSQGKVRTCDLLIGVYARRYGTTLPDGRSVTEAEYDAAKAASLPRVCFWLRVDADWPAEFVEGEPGAGALARFRAKVWSEVIVKEFSNLEELQAAVGAAADEYLQKETYRRRRRVLLASLVALLTAATVVLALLVAETRPRLVRHREIPAPAANDYTCLAAGSATFATGHANGDIYLWDPQSGIPRSLGNVRGWVKRLAFCPAQDLLVSVAHLGNDSELVCWALAEGSVRWKRPWSEGEGFFTELAVQQQGILLAVGSSSGTVYVLDATGEVVRTCPVPALEFGLEPERFGLVMDIAAAPDGRSVAIAYRNGVFATLDLMTGRFERLLVGDEPNVRGTFSVCYVGAEDLALSGQVYHRGTFNKLWSHRRDRQSVLAESDNFFWRLARLGNSRYCLSANWNGEVELWDGRRPWRLASATTQLNSPPDQQILGLGYVPESKIVLGITEKTLYSWKVEWRSLGEIPVFWERAGLW